MADNFFGQTDTGKTRSNNEDTFIAQQVMGNRYVLGCVIDGVGGYSGGEVAAAIAHKEILATFNQPQADIIPAMVKAFKWANRGIMDRKKEDATVDSMACVSTMAIADVANNRFYYAHVGDTRLYLLRDFSLVKITRDQSFVGFLEDSGRLTETEAMRHPKRNEINKALGFTEQVETDEEYIETGQSPFLPGDILLLCTDGLTDMVDKAEITDIITRPTSLKQKTTQLIEAANNNGGSDNITVVLLQNDKAPQVSNATKPASATIKKNEAVTEEAPAVIPDTPTHTTSSAPVIVKKNGGLVAILALLCLAFFATSVWLYTKLPDGSRPTKAAVAAAGKATPDPQEIKLQAAIDSLKGDTLILADSAYKSPIVLNNPLRINRPALRIISSGKLAIINDTSYTGPPLVLLPQCRQLALEGVWFEDFKQGIVITNSTLTLKHVRFVNMKSPVQYYNTFPDSTTVSATLPAVTIIADSVIQPAKPANATK